MSVVSMFGSSDNALNSSNFMPETSELESFPSETPQSLIVPMFSTNLKSKMSEEYKIHNFLGIEKVLHQNRSDAQKLNELVNKLNRTDALKKVNIESNEMQIRHSVTPLPRSTALQFRDYTNAQPYEQNDHQKDSKELKVQFVLDCDLKDSLNSISNLNQPVILPYISSNPDIKKNEIRYPNYQSLFNQRIPIRKQVMSYYQTTRRSSYSTKKPTKRVVKAVTTPKLKVKYVDPPAVAAISNAFENVYNYFEDALTTNVVQKIPREKKRVVVRKNVRVHGQGRNPIRKRSTVNYLATTSRPEYRYTKAYSNGPNQKLTTQIHVTSEYVGTEPTAGGKQNEDISDVSESGQYDDDVDDAESGEEYSDEDEDENDYDYDFSFGSFGGGDEEDDESGELNEQYNPDTPSKLYKSKRKRPKNKRRVSKHNSDDNESEEEEEEEEDGFTMTNMGKYFQQTYDSISEYISVFPSVFGSDDDEIYDDDETTSRIPKKKISLYSRSPNRIKVKETNKKWYDKFFFGSDADSDEAEPSPMNIAVPSTTTKPGLFQWFSSSEDTTERVITKPETEKPDSSETNSNWFSSFFYGSETTTIDPIKSEDVSTKTSIISDEKKNEWFAMLAAHMGTMTTPTTHTINRTNVLRRIKYDDYQIWRVTPSTQAQLAVLREYKESDEEEKILWLKGPAMRGPNDILISPDMNKDIQEMLEYEAIPYEVVVWDLEKAIKYENPIMSRRQKIELEKEQGHPMTWFRYHNFEDIAIYLDYLQITYPDIVDLIHIGRSFEGRPLIIVKISFDSIDDGLQRNNVKTKASLKNRRKKKTLKPGIFIEAGVHGREWISPAVATWILKELVKFNNTENGNTEKELVRSVDWYILPVSNPDGYEFSLNYDRLWRKTRSKLPETGSSMLKYALKWLRPEQKNDAPICHGTDPSRNYDINWQTKGSSQSACSESYSGPNPFSEPETKAVAAFLNENRKMISIFLSLHSYGQFISYPSTANSTYGATQRSNDLRDMAEIAVNALRDFASTGRYSIDSTNEMLPESSGTSTDYAMHKAGIKYSYTIELRDTGTQGFLLSPSYIDTTGLETFEMVKAMVDFL